MRVLEQNAADPFRDREQKHVVTESGRPIGNSKTDPFARDHSSAANQEQRRKRSEPNETIEPARSEPDERRRYRSFRHVCERDYWPLGLGEGWAGFCSGFAVGFSVFGAPGGGTVPGVEPTCGSPAGRCVAGGAFCVPANSARSFNQV